MVKISKKQKLANEIEKNTLVELREKFGDINNIDYLKAIDIQKYCTDKYKIYENKNEFSLHYIYWKHMADLYQKGIDYSIEPNNKII